MCDEMHPSVSVTSTLMKKMMVMMMKLNAVVVVPVGCCGPSGMLCTVVVWKDV